MTRRRVAGLHSHLLPNRQRSSRSNPPTRASRHCSCCFGFVTASPKPSPSARVTNGPSASSEVDHTHVCLHERKFMITGSIRPTPQCSTGRAEPMRATDGVGVSLQIPTRMLFFRHPNDVGHGSWSARGRLGPLSRRRLRAESILKHGIEIPYTTSSIRARASSLDLALDAGMAVGGQRPVRPNCASRSGPMHSRWFELLRDQQRYQARLLRPQQEARAQERRRMATQRAFQQLFGSTNSLPNPPPRSESTNRTTQCTADGTAARPEYSHRLTAASRTRPASRRSGRRPIRRRTARRDRSTPTRNSGFAPLPRMRT